MNAMPASEYEHPIGLLTCPVPAVSLIGLRVSLIGAATSSACSRNAYRWDRVIVVLVVVAVVSLVAAVAVTMLIVVAVVFVVVVRTCYGGAPL